MGPDSTREERAALRRLASAWGVQTAYVDTTGRRRVAGAEALTAVLRALGAPIEKPSQAREALRHRQAELESRKLPPVLLAAEGRLPPFELRLRRAPQGAVGAVLELEDGGTLEVPLIGADRRHDDRAVAVRLRSRRRIELPPGVHRLRLDWGRWERPSAHVLAGPGRCWSGDTARRLAVFAPLYALHSERSWGVGDLRDLQQLATWARSRGVDLVAVLPLLAGFFDRPFEPSPYSPATRLFWNELYVDPRLSPELDHCAEAWHRLEGQELRAELDSLRRRPSVDYRAAMRLKRLVLEPLARAAFADPRRRAEIEELSRNEPHLEDYARFRSALERRGSVWHEWPRPLRDGELAASDWSEEARRYHLYVQWLCDRQLARLRDEGAGLYLDVPLGVSAAGYDVWRFRTQFAHGVTAGSPPDAFFAEGQNWGFPPPHPHHGRRDGHAYFRRSLRAHLRRSSMVRLDHVMALHRLFWIPDGFPAEEGVYVRYPARELYAILALESHRHRCRIVGENLGTVPREVDRALRRFDLLPMHILQFELSGEEDRPLPEPRQRTLAGLNTHDMAPFAAFWEGTDIDLRLRLRLLDEDEASEEAASRRRLRRRVTAALEREGWLQKAPEGAATESILQGLLRWLARSKAEVVVVQLEDLWQEKRPQNVPGVVEEIPPWRRKTRPTLESIIEDVELGGLLEALARLRSDSNP